MHTTFIDIRDLRVKCLIGVWRHERTTPQELSVDVSVEIDGRAAAESDDLNTTFNYAGIANQISFILEEGRFKLLETACWMIQRCLLLSPPDGVNRPIARSVDVRLSKFGVLPGDAIAVVRSVAHAADVAYEEEEKPWGTVDIVAESRDVGLYRLNLSPGGYLPSHFHQVMREAELSIHPGLELREEEGPWRPLTAGDRFQWPNGHVHGYRNAGRVTSSLLCIDAPCFDPNDEILTGAGP